MNVRLESTGDIVHRVAFVSNAGRMTDCGVKYIQQDHRVDKTEEVDCMACIATTPQAWVYAFLGAPWP